MSQSKSFWEHPVEVLEEALSIKKQIAALEQKLSKLFGGQPPSPAAKPKKGAKRPVSAEARAKMAAAQKARWLKAKGATPAEGASAAKAAAKKRSGITPEGRAKLAAAMKARWAAKKGATPSAETPAPES